jgi:hypothetical protein
VKLIEKPMKNLVIKLSALALIPLMATSCMTTYDAQGQPVQSVDPGAAAVGVAAAAVLGYAVANNRSNKYYYGGPYYGGGGGYYGGGYRGGYCRY